MQPLPVPNGTGESYSCWHGFHEFPEWDGSAGGIKDVVRLEGGMTAAGDLLNAALLGEGWGEALQRLADAVEAGGVSLVRVKAGRALAQLSSTEWEAAEAELMAGSAPPSPLRFYPYHAFGDGYRADHDVWNDD